MEYETIKSEDIEYRGNKFLEVSRKKALPDGNIFLNISKGYYTPEGDKRYQKGVGFPADDDFVKDLINKIKAVAED
ncbi:MAG: hypothetical protein B6U97_01485 [Candidatus Altiarchaeales archaeon ex4484_96]|nr:MAG: hypothetical protein B6U97_01485 [Candidatus Altiarchaeales archaeon ex4484_96]